MAQVVAHQEGGRLLAAHGCARFDQSRQAVAAIEPGPEDELPQTMERPLYRHQQGAFDAHRVIVARRGTIRRVEVVDDVDATDESDPTIDQGELAVQSAQPMASQAEACNLRPVDHCLHAGSLQVRLLSVGEVRRAETVDENPHDDAAAGGGRQRRGNGLPGFVILEDVALEVHLALCRGDRCQQRREIFAAAVEQPQTVAGQELGCHARTGSGRGGRTASTSPAAGATAD